MGQRNASTADTLRCMRDGPVSHLSASSEGALGLERILDLETKLARAPVIGRKRRELVKAIGIAAAAYRMTLDNEQATAIFEPLRLTIATRASVRHSTHRKSNGSKRSQP
jgi:hypothetical protein